MNEKELWSIFNLPRIRRTCNKKKCLIYSGKLDVGSNYQKACLKNERSLLSMSRWFLFMVKVLMRQFVRGNPNPVEMKQCSKHKAYLLSHILTHQETRKVDFGGRVTLSLIDIFLVDILSWKNYLLHFIFDKFT